MVIAKDFDAEPDEASGEQVQFKLFGETWHCREEIDGASLLRFVAEIDSDRPREQALAFLGFFDQVLVPDELEEFKDLLESPDHPIRLKKLGEVVGWIVEQTTERPTQQPVPLPVGGARRARTSTASSRGKARR